MYVCHCRAITDHEIRDAIEQGATSLETLAAATGAGVRCGGCWPALYDLLDETAGADRPAYAG
jgi:bacterioferritin-associated ferredoxin